MHSGLGTVVEQGSARQQLQPKFSPGPQTGCITRRGRRGKTVLKKIPLAPPGGNRYIPFTFARLLVLRIRGCHVRGCRADGVRLVELIPFAAWGLAPVISFSR
jgi:hypothetical protein